MVRHTHSHSSAGRDGFGQVGAFWDEDRERSRPETGSELEGYLGDINRHFLQLTQVTEQDWDCFFNRPIFCRIDGLNRLSVKRQRADPINGIGREGNETTCT